MQNEFIIKKINTNLCLSRKNKKEGLVCQCNNLKINDTFCKKHNNNWNCLVFDMPDKKTLNSYYKFKKINDTPFITFEQFNKNKNIINSMTIPLLKKT